MGYLVLETDTGFMDGWYMHEADAIGVMEYLDDARPSHTHVVVHKVAGPDRCGFPDRIWVSEKPFRWETAEEIERMKSVARSRDAGRYPSPDQP